MNGLLLFELLLDCQDGPVRVWIIYSGPWFNMHERQYRIAPLVNALTMRMAASWCPPSQYRELLRNTEPAGAAPLPRWPVLSPTSHLDSRSWMAMVIRAADPLLVAYGETGIRVSTTTRADESDHTVFALWEWAMRQFPLVAGCSEMPVSLRLVWRRPADLGSLKPGVPTRGLSD